MGALGWLTNLSFAGSPFFVPVGVRLTAKSIGAPFLDDKSMGCAVVTGTSIGVPFIDDESVGVPAITEQSVGVAHIADKNVRPGD